MKIVCTAGHIDHGKTALVKALTGVDTDRLTEEKLRGITIDIGFAPYGDDVTIIDLPGHERFIRNMVAGAATVDFALLVIAGDDGIMPQTREHFAILRLLGIKDGMVVITKADLADIEWIELVIEDARELVKGSFLEEKSIIPVDSISLKGFTDFKNVFDDALYQIPARESRPEFRLPIDRSFTIKGFGTVVTGTAIGGKIAVKDTVEHFPSQKLLKVRGIQIHGKEVTSTRTGDRAALNLVGVEKGEVERGEVLAEPGFLKTTMFIDCQVELLPASAPLKHRERLRFHIGTAEIIGRILLLQGNTIEPGGEALVQLELEKPVAVLRGDRFVFRTYSPQTTIGGGMILASAEAKHKRNDLPIIELLTALFLGKGEEIILKLLEFSGVRGLPANEIFIRSGLIRIQTQEILVDLIARDLVTWRKFGGEDWYIANSTLDGNLEKIISFAEDFHRNNPAKTGFTSAELKSKLLPQEETPFIDYTLEMAVKRGILLEKGSIYALPEHEIKLTPRQSELSRKMLEIIHNAGFSTPKAHPLAEALDAEVDEIMDLMAILESLGELHRLDRDTVIDREVFADALQKIQNLVENSGIIRLPEAVEALKQIGASGRTSRRTTVALLEYMDKIGITIRFGDERKFKD